MAGVHDLDHISLDLGPTPGTASTSKAPPKPSAAPTTNPANAKLEPFLLLAKSARGAGAARLIGEALGASGVYVFGELLEMKGVVELATSEEHAKYHALLEIFAYGTWLDYQEKATNLPKLNPAQETKLKHLTIVSLASQSRIIPYSTLLTSLSLPSVRHLEDLIIEAIYAQLLSARLDQKYSRLEIDSCMGRDVRPSSAAGAGVGGEDVDMDGAGAVTVAGPGSVGELRERLGKWSESVAGVLGQLDVYIEGIKKSDARKAEDLNRHRARVSKLVEEAQENKKKSSFSSQNVGTSVFDFAAGGGGSGPPDQMEVDDQKSGGKTKGASKTRKRGRT